MKKITIAWVACLFLLAACSGGNGVEADPDSADTDLADTDTPAVEDNSEGDNADGEEAVSEEELDDGVDNTAVDHYSDLNGLFYDLVEAYEEHIEAFEEEAWEDFVSEWTGDVEANIERIDSSDIDADAKDRLTSAAGHLQHLVTVYTDALQGGEDGQAEEQINETFSDFIEDITAAGEIIYEEL